MVASTPSKAPIRPSAPIGPPVRVVIFDLRGDLGRGALLRVAGLPVVLRNLLLLQRRGYGRVVLLCDPDVQPATAALLRLPNERISIPLVWGDDDSALPPFDPGDEILYWPGGVSFGRYLPDFVDEPIPPGGTLELSGGPDRPSVLRTRGATLHAAPPGPLSAQLLWARQQGLTTRLASNREMFLVATADDARRAERALLRSLRKNADGAVAKYDRYVSLSISRRLMSLPITPNQVTFVAATLGVLCGVAAGHGGYAWMLAGALGFQLNSIFDGIDGEIARAKLLESHVGQWLDTIADDLSNLAFFVGAGIGSYRTYGWLGYLVLGVAAGVGQLMTSAVQYHNLLKVAHSGDLNDVVLPWARYSVAQRPLGTSNGRSFLSKFQWVFRRDAFAAFSTMFAALGQLRVLTWAFALGANTVWVMILGYHAFNRRLAARRIEAV